MILATVRWTTTEDDALATTLQQHGTSWKNVAASLAGSRSAKACRGIHISGKNRWFANVRPSFISACVPRARTRAR